MNRGLGLAISKQLVELMGGEIGVTSELGHGSSFSFTIVCAPADASSEIRFAPLLSGQRLLVVDASEVTRGFVKTSLSRDGARCKAVARGAHALLELRKGLEQNDPYALLVMESGTCDEHGVELSGPIRSNPAYRRPPGGEKHVADASVSASASKEYRVLVAEDNRTNKVVAAGMLRMLGCQCQLASNGREALQSTRDGSYDLILMDCSMPEMDGYEATARIRNFEEAAGRRTPIVAMTANTQRGDAEKCLAAGMDDYLAKPITLADLRQKLERWLPRGAGPMRMVLVDREPADTGEDPLDHETFEHLRDVLGPSLDQAIRPFLEDMPAYYDLLSQAIDEGDAVAAREIAHSIKGSSGNLGATTLSQIAKQAHELAGREALEDIRPLLPRLREAFDVVSAVLATEAGGDFRLVAEAPEQTALVLVVDDDRSTRSALRYTLQRDGFRVEEASDGAQALALLEDIVPDVILMDAVMPVMDGFAACAQVKERLAARAVPVLMITALEDNSSVERAFAAGASDYIPKPIHFAVLSQRVRSIIDANRAERHIRRLAYNDSLTGLPNRALFLDQLARRIEQVRPHGETVAVLFLDLDRFKYVNDTLGHDIGDRLLAAVAHRIRRVVRHADCVARLGGDEFTVALTALTGPAAAAAAQNIRKTLKHPFQIDGHDIFIGASIGISLYPQDGPDVVTLLKHADMAMYRAKKDSSGFQFFEASMEHSMSGHLRLENDLRRALERDEFELFYQPKARVDTGALIGIEALMRWHHPTRGLVLPNTFIPLAEETGLIVAAGEWALRTACNQLQAWIKSGHAPVRVAVNISGRQLLQRDFVASVERILHETALPPDLLELEITESTLMEYAQDTLELLRRLREIGVFLAIDDFGTGYSSLAYLKRFPVNAVKVDRAFVNDVPDDADDVAIVTGIIALAHSLRLEVVAEGVETAEQLAFLRERRCDQMQGYMLSEPLPAPLFEETFLRPAAAKLSGNAPEARARQL